MTDMPPVQKFQIGQRVRAKGEKPFVISDIRIRFGRIPSGRIYYSAGDTGWYEANELTLCLERPPYVPSERLVMRRLEVFARFASASPECYRCETDAELAVRHAAEMAEYGAQEGGT